MGNLYLVRHGQASFGAANYDQLSELGHRQCVRLGEYFRERGVRFQAVITGTLERHRQSQAAIAEGAQARHEPIERPGLNEYDSAALIAAVHTGVLERPRTPEQVRHHFRLLRDGLKRWIDGSAQPAGMPSHRDFVAGVAEVLDHVRSTCDGDVLLVSSGGPISTAVALILGAAPEVAIDLNMRMRNSALTEFAYTPRRHMLVTYNTLPHLEAAAQRDWVTFT